MGAEDVGDFAEAAKRVRLDGKLGEAGDRQHYQRQAGHGNSLAVDRCPRPLARGAAKPVAHPAEGKPAQDETAAD